MRDIKKSNKYHQEQMEVKKSSDEKKVQENSLYSWWVAHLKEHPFKIIGTAISIYGGLFLLIFFFQLGSMPELDLAGATATLAAVAIIGLLVVITLGGTMIAAGLFTRSLALDTPHLLSWKSLLGIAAPGCIFNILVVLTISFDVLTFKSWWVGGLVGVSIIIAIFCCWRQSSTDTRVIASDCLNNPEGIGCQSQIIAYEAKNGIFNSVTFEAYFSYISSGFIWSVSALIAFYIYGLLSMHGNTSDALSSWGLIFWSIASIVVNILVAKSPSNILGSICLTMAGASVVLVTILTASWSAMPVAVVHSLGLGEIPVGVVVTPEGCDTFNKAARGQRVCQMDSEQKQGWACPVILKSRIGTPLVFELTSLGDNGSWPISLREIASKNLGEKVMHQRFQRIQLNKSDVISWPAVTPLPKVVTSKSSSTDSEKNTEDQKNDNQNSDTLIPQSRAEPLLTYLDQNTVRKNENGQLWLVEQCGEAHDLKSVK